MKKTSSAELVAKIVEYRIIGIPFLVFVHTGLIWTLLPAVAAIPINLRIKLVTLNHANVTRFARVNTTTEEINAHNERIKHLVNTLPIVKGALYEMADALYMETAISPHPIIINRVGVSFGLIKEETTLTDQEFSITDASISLSTVSRLTSYRRKTPNDKNIRVHGAPIDVSKIHNTVRSLRFAHKHISTKEAAHCNFDLTTVHWPTK